MVQSIKTEHVRFEGVELWMKDLKIEGRNSVIALLQKGTQIKEINVDESAREDDRLTRILALAEKKGVQVKRVPRWVLDRMSSTGSHMGVIAVAHGSFTRAKLTDVLGRCAEKGEDPFLLFLVELSYEQNIGAIIRTANAAGVHGIVMCGKHKPLATPEIVRISMGAVFFTPVIQEGIYAALKMAKSAGLCVVGTDMVEGEQHYDIDLRGRVAIVLGNEDRGLTEGVKKRCDKIARIPMRGVVSSLNVSVTCGVLLFEKLRQERSSISSGT